LGLLNPKAHTTIQMQETIVFQKIISLEFSDNSHFIQRGYEQECWLHAQIPNGLVFKCHSELDHFVQFQNGSLSNGHQT
jgi:hypothetical protein